MFLNDTTYALGAELAVLVPTQMYNTASGGPYYERVVVDKVSRWRANTSVTAEFGVYLMLGTSDAQVAQMGAVVLNQSSVLFSTMPNTTAAYLNGVAILPSSSLDARLSSSAKAGIAIGVLAICAVTALVAIFFIQRAIIMHKILPPTVRSSYDGTHFAPSHHASPTPTKPRRSHKMADRLLEVAAGALKPPPSPLTSPTKAGGALNGGSWEMSSDPSLAAPPGVVNAGGVKRGPSKRPEELTGKWVVSIQAESASPMVGVGKGAAASPFPSWAPAPPQQARNAIAPSRPGAAPAPLPSAAAVPSTSATWQPQQAPQRPAGFAGPSGAWAPAERAPPPPLGAVSALGRHATEAGHVPTDYGNGRSRVQPSGYSYPSGSFPPTSDAQAAGSVPFVPYQHTGAGPMAESLSSADSVQWAATEREFVTVRIRKDESVTSQVSQRRGQLVREGRDVEHCDAREDSMQALPGCVEQLLSPAGLLDSLAHRQHSSLSHNSMSCSGGRYVRSSLGKGFGQGDE
ncbi:MAG: hypothetical protein WDW38_006909 [Sanguina aurantia]